MSRSQIPIFCALILTIFWPCGARGEAPASEAPLSYVVIVTGSELLQGAYADKHLPFITRTLRPLGGRCAGALTVDDQMNELRDALQFAARKASLVIVTGGLGPTPNDITRETISEFTGIELREDPQVLQEMEKRFQVSRAELRTNLLRQARVPARGGFLANRHGTAVGLVFDAAPALIIALPGPPGELQPMMTREVVPLLHRRFGIRTVGSSITLRFIGAGQSLIDQQMQEHIPLPADLMVTSYFEAGRVDFTLALPGGSPEDHERLAALKAKLKDHFNHFIYAEDNRSLEQVIGERLEERQQDLTLVEMGTLGQLAAALQEAPVLRSRLTAGYAASTEEKMARLLGRASGPDTQEKTAEGRLEELARTAAETTQSDWVLATSPVVASDSGRHLWATFKSPSNQVETFRFSLGTAGEGTNPNFFNPILERFWRMLNEIESGGAINR